jgi:predicted enzyme related to lactoylglutathione lyase
MANTIVWVDIPVVEMARATTFYSAVLAAKLEPIPGMDGAVFPHQGEEVGGCLFRKAGEMPSGNGPLIYLNCQGRLDDAIAQVEPNGGLVLKPKHAIGPYGQIAVIRDSEGNRIALHSM